MSEHLCDSLYDTVGHVQINWQFILDDKQRPTISGQVQTQLHMLCHRCLTPVTISINVKVALVVFTEEPSQYEELLPDYEAIVLPNKPVPLSNLIENELILAIPIVAKHEVCPSNEFQMQDEDIEDVEDVDKPSDNPFSMLEKLSKS
ncbi:YceD family protein [Thiotrichales bacterium HSG1]|nr:YceD family protein [Thiotrichales bacterium HSG1]